jgi:hypothetical protein
MTIEEKHDLETKKTITSQFGIVNLSEIRHNFEQNSWVKLWITLLFDYTTVGENFNYVSIFSNNEVCF